MKKSRDPKVKQKVLEAYVTASQRVWVIHLDTARVLPRKRDAEGNLLDPEPDPEWCETFAWGIDVEREVAWRETLLLVKDRLQVRGVLGRRPDDAEGEEFSV